MREFLSYYFFECTLKDTCTLTAKMVMFCHQQPKWDHDPWFVPETTSIPDLTYSSPPVFEHQPSKAIIQLLAACQVNNFREIEVDGRHNNFFIARKKLWFFLSDSIQGKSLCTVFPSQTYLIFWVRKQSTKTNNLRLQMIFLTQETERQTLPFGKWLTGKKQKWWKKKKSIRCPHQASNSWPLTR